MSPEARSAEDLFLCWLIGLPETSDPAEAAAVRLAELRAESGLDAVEWRLCELLRQVTPFACAAPAGRRRRQVRRG